MHDGEQMIDDAWNLLPLDRSRLFDPDRSAVSEDGEVVHHAREALERLGEDMDRRRK